MLATLKKWCVARSIQPVLDALSTIFRDNNLTGKLVERVVVRLPKGQAEGFSNRSMPDFNVLHVVALFLLDGHLSFDRIHSYPLMKDPHVLAFRSRIELRPDTKLTTERKATRKALAIVEVVTTDRKHLVERSGPLRGTPDNPMTTQEVVDKGLELMSPVLGKKRARSLVVHILRLDKVSSVRSLRPLLQP